MSEAGSQERVNRAPFDVWHAFICGCRPLPEYTSVTCRDTCRAGRGERRSSARPRVICEWVPPGPGTACGTKRDLEHSSDTRHELKAVKALFCDAVVGRVQQDDLSILSVLGIFSISRLDPQHLKNKKSKKLFKCLC